MAWYYNDAGDRLWYEECGEGTPLLLVHGWCMSSTIWRFQFDSLSSSFRVIAPDLRGHGRSQARSGTFSLGDFAGDIAALFRHLNLSGVILTGWSLGAQIAVQSLPLLGERTSGLVLMCSTPCFTVRESFPYGLAPIEANGMKLKVRRNIRRALEGFTARMFAAGEMDSTTLADRIAQVLADIPLPDIDVALQALDVLVETDLRSQLTAIRVPTLIISGQHDVICPSAASAYMAGIIPVCEHVCLAGCGHAPFLTRSQAVNGCFVNFLEKLYDTRD